MNINWTNELNFNLIDLYRHRPVLWDVTLEDHRDKTKKKEAWYEIAEYFNTERAVVEKKMKILIGQFRRELATTGEEGTKWYAFKSLLFLKSKYSKRESTSEGFQSHNETEDILMKKEDETDDEVDNTLITPDTSEDRRKQTPDYKEIHKRDDEGRHKSEKFREEQTRDEFSVFGEHIANKLRKITNNFARNTAEFHINKILYKAEMGEYDSVGTRKNKNAGEWERSSGSKQWYDARPSRNEDSDTESEF